jgi:tetratricopeptide (TPR) repeat protein
LRSTFPALAALTALLLAAAAGAGGLVSPSVDAAPPAPGLDPWVGFVDVDALPGADDPELRRLWVEGLRLEYAQQTLASAARYEQIVERRPDAAEAYWRVARNYWRTGDDLPAEQVDERSHYFQLSDDWAQRGLERDSECAECMLWRFASLGRLATTRGILSGARNASTMADMIDRGIALHPTHRDSAHNSTLGNLYFASSTFHRMVPDWWWLKLIVGVRGDKERALRDIRKAVELSEGRVDYQVELGAVLLCLGESKNRPENVKEAREVLRGALELEPLLPSDAKEAAYARLLLEESSSPSRNACNYSREGFIDIEGARDKL